MIDGTVSLSEAYDLVMTLAKTDGTMLRASYLNIERLSTESRQLVDVFNAVIAGIQAKPGKKKSLFKKLKKPRIKNNNQEGKISMADRKQKLARIKIAGKN